MSKRRIGPHRFARTFFTMLFALAAFSVSARAATVEVRGVRHSSDAERTRVVIDLSTVAPYEHFTLSDPARVVVALDDAAFGADAKARTIGDGFVDRIRINALHGNRIQIVLDLKRELAYEVFTLADPARIVVDVSHEAAAAKPPEPAPKESSSAESSPPNGESAPPAVSAPQVTAPQKVIPAEAPHHGTWTIAVDAGHGGDDPGSSHHGTREKDIALALAIEVQRELSSRPGIDAFLTRKGDYFIPLRKRRSIAEEKGADLFVSIHCDGLDRKDVRGTSVYFLSLTGASDEASRELAERENRVDQEMGVAPGEDLQDILFNMTQTDVLAKSEMLAEMTLHSLLDVGTVYDRGVKQAGFAVLKSPRTPSILVEAAFISNPDENKLLRDPKWRARFARELADGVEAYCRSVDRAE